MEPRNASGGETRLSRIIETLKGRQWIWLVATYLAAIVAANLISAEFGPGASIFNAFAFIGFDLTSRDKLHEAWHGKRLAVKMGLLIAAGSALSYALNRQAGMIAVASLVAFSGSAILDSTIYAILGKRSRATRVTGSNLVSSLADSLLFPTIAFGGFMPLVTLGQFAAKVVGGALWMLILTGPRAALKGEG